MPAPVRIASRADFDGFFRTFLNGGGIPAEYHPYFHQSSDRLWLTSQAFGLFSRRYGELLEIGPGFAFLPFLWKASIAERVAILDGELPELDAIEHVYRAHGIEPHWANLFRLFADRDPQRARLPYATDRFDAAICWETMEHFNFNPIPFLQELLRVLRPGGVAHLTVPNQAKLDFRLRLLLGRSVRTPIRDYVLQMDDRNHMQYAPHWREYTLAEYTELLRHVGFRIESARHLHTFENREASLARSLKRGLARVATTLVPSFGTLCVVTAVKPGENR